MVILSLTNKQYNLTSDKRLRSWYIGCSRMAMEKRGKRGH